MEIVSSNINEKKIKLGIVSTTIRGDLGYRDWDEAVNKFGLFDARFYIAGDLNSIEFNQNGFHSELKYFSPEQQSKYECSEKIGWRKWARRNIALIEALRDDPDYILIIDDDNRPLENYFQKWHNLITLKAKKLLSTDSLWFNYLDSGDSKSAFYPRGYPIQERGRNLPVAVIPCEIAPEEIYVFQGISLGDPDIDAFARIADPTSLPLKSVSEYNYAVANKWSPYNTQNTLFKRDIAPLAFTWPMAGRYEDIYSSYVWQHFSFSHKKYIHVGDSLNWQDRGERDNFRDFCLEHEGYIRALDVWNSVRHANTSSIEQLLISLSTSDCDVIKRESDFFVSYMHDIKKLGII